MPSHYAKDTIKIELQSPSGESYAADVYFDTKLKDLVVDFYEFLGKEEYVDELFVEVQLIDPGYPQIIRRLDVNLTIGELEIKNGDKLLIVGGTHPAINDDSVVVEFVDSTTLQIVVSLPGNMPVYDYTNFLDKLLINSDFVYSIFSILQTQDAVALTRLGKLVAQRDLGSIQSHSLYSIVEGVGVKPLGIAKLHYGSPLTIDFEGIWKPLEFLRDVIKDLKWRGKHEKEIAEMERQKMIYEIVDKYLEQAEKINKLKLPKEMRSKLLVAMLPRVAGLESALMVSFSEEQKTRRNVARKANQRESRSQL
jgi:hypothetical protein